MARPLRCASELVGVGVPHAQRREDVLCDVGLVGLAADDLHDKAKHVVVGVRVLEFGADAMAELHVGQGMHPVAERLIADVVAEHGPERAVLRQAAGVVQQVADGYLR